MINPIQMKLPSFFYEIYFNLYLKKHQDQIKTIDRFCNIPQTILLISNTALGDTLLSTPLMQSIKISFPSSRLVALIHQNYIPLVQNCSFIDKIIAFHGSYNHFFKTLKEIKNESPTLALIPHGNAPQDIMLAVLSGCKFILKHPTNSPLKKNLSYTFDKKEQHTIEERLDLARIIHAQKLIKEMSIGKLENQATELKITKIMPKKFKYIGLQIGAADIFKMWPIERFIELAQKIIAKSSYKIVLTGVQSEYALAQKIVTACKEDSVINLCGKLSIEELPYLLKKLQVLITNDTGTMHLAIAVKTPTISLFSPTCSKGIGPYQDLNLHRVIQKDGSFMAIFPKKKRSNEAMKLIQVDEVFSMTMDLLQ